MSFSPYATNGGTILAIAGSDFAVVSGDTRQVSGLQIQTRYAPRVFRLTDRATLAVALFAADVNVFVKTLKQRLELYRHAHNKDMPLRAIARLIHTMLYGKRFFPYYIYPILGGIEEDGSGAIYSYDPVGSYERETYRSSGSASSLIQPFLDNQIKFKNQVELRELHSQYICLYQTLFLLSLTASQAPRNDISRLATDWRFTWLLLEAEVPLISLESLGYKKSQPRQASLWVDLAQKSVHSSSDGI